MTVNDSAMPKRLVLERLEFVNIISSLNTQFRVPSLIRETENGGWTHPWMYFDSLRSYLLLTCFDLLGQPAPYKDFQCWLSASSTKADRDAALATVEKEPSLIAAVGYVHRQYLAQYGTKNSFYRFIKEILPTAARTDLLYSVHIRMIDPQQNKEVRKIESDDEKTAFLYNVRNVYTHRAVNIGSPAGGVFPNWGAPMVIDGVPKQGWEPIYTKGKDGLLIEYSVRGWPNVLIRTVELGLKSVTGQSAA